MKANAIGLMTELLRTLNILIILSDTSHDISVPLKVIRLGRFQPGKMRPIKTIFSMATDVFDIIRNKKKISHSNLPSTINISTDRTPNQRESMKKLCEELASRTNNGEIGLTIKFQRGVPKIIKIIGASNIQSQNPKNF